MYAILVSPNQDIKDQYGHCFQWLILNVENNQHIRANLVIIVY